MMRILLVIGVLVVALGAWLLTTLGARPHPEQASAPPPRGAALTPESGTSLAVPRPVPAPAATDEHAPEPSLFDAHPGADAGTGEGPADGRSQVEAPVAPYVPIHPLHPRPAEPGRIAGWVLDENGRPFVSHLKLELTGGKGGSYNSSGENKEVFDLDFKGMENFVLKAATVDGRIALHDLRNVSADQALSDVVLRLEPGARVEISFDGTREKARCALFTGGLRHADFRIVRGQHPRLTVPAGMLHVQLYSGDVVYAERFVRLQPGQEEDLSFRLDA